MIKNLSLSLFMRLCFLIAVAQDRISCDQYKVQYDKGDSVVSLIGKMIYNGRKLKTGEISYGKHISDSCLISYWYDEHDNPSKEVTICSDGQTAKSIVYQTRYDGYGKIIGKESIQTVPFFQLIHTQYFKDSIVEVHYSDSVQLANGAPDGKDIQILDNSGKKVAEFGIKENGDTEIIYLDNYRREHLINYYDNHKLAARVVKNYDFRNHLLGELYYNMAKGRYTYSIKYTYAADGSLSKKERVDFDIDLKKVYWYRNGLALREEYIFGKTLDHTINYVYR